MLKLGILLKSVIVIVLCAVFTAASWLIPYNRPYTGNYNGYDYSVLIMRAPFGPTKGDGSVTKFLITKDGTVVASFNREWIIIPDTVEKIETTNAIIERHRNIPYSSQF